MVHRPRPPSIASFSDDEADEVDQPLVFSPAQWSTKRLHPAPTPTVPFSQSPILQLPAEILIQVFRQLHSLRDLYSTLRVCRAWCECSVELLWYKPTIDHGQTLSRISRILASPNQTFTYAGFVRRLNFLALSDRLTDQVFANFVSCVRLERLTLVGCNKLSSATLAQVIPNFTNLVAIDASGVRSVTDDLIIGVARTAPRIQGLNLTGCSLVTDAAIMEVARNCPQMRRIKMSHLESLTDQSIQALATSCPLLLEIDINHCKLITDNAIRQIWLHCDNVRELRFAHCELLTDLAFPVPHKQNPVIDNNNPFPNNKPAEELPPLILGNRMLEHMRMLDLTACSKITDEAIEGIISHAPRIRNLSLPKCSQITDKGLEAICKLGRYLHYLHLGHADKISDRAVRTLARSCVRLRYVDFANCTKLTDLAVFELANLSKLRRIGLVRVSNITDEAVYALAERHSTLERIHLSYCDQVTVMAIHFLLQKLHKLTHLSLTGVPAFRQPELQQFCRPAPSDFNSNQVTAFCVFSGKGVTNLRAFLTELFDRITELNGTDDTDYDDDDYEEGEVEEGEGEEVYDEDDGQDVPEPDEEEEEVDPGPLPRRPWGSRGLPQLPPGETSTMLNLHAATDRLNAQLASSSRNDPYNHQNGDRHRHQNEDRHRHYHQTSQRPSERTLADIWPIVERTASPPLPPLPTGSRGGTLVGSRRVSDPVGMQAQAYDDIGRGQRAREGHGQAHREPRNGHQQHVQDSYAMRRGHEHFPQHRQHGEQSRGGETQRVERLRTERPSLWLAGSSTTSFEVVSASGSERERSQVDLGAGAGATWPIEEPGSPTASTIVGDRDRDMEWNDRHGERERDRPREERHTERERDRQQDNDGRGRHGRRGLRETLNVAEHYANSLLLQFARSPPRNGATSTGVQAGTSGNTRR
ncbi:RNI-like protein [Cylindrobasidium torrendii FP15055 ss-10]|uniref:RNI-like protein n=1 Tax=Cylindrobasidium torrendii FP15055 ss-10 TaxID=1314674 RepID=A0A0D7BUW3_9AGAR|nr:RNI-like protein [Cylindrobasidium torrendii FP15055 ss-10]